MKKIFQMFLLLVTLTVVGTSKVGAETYKGKLYEEYHPASGFSVFAAESNGYMDYNSWMIKSTVDDRIYYCIDPAIALEGSSEGSHDYITGKDNITDGTLLTNDKYKKVQLLAYYGYGYKDNNVDHTSKKWYGITQVMIWRVMRPDLTWTFKESRNSTPSNALFSEEVKEMNNLVDNHDKFPSFKDKTVKVLLGSSEIKDTNKVISSFELKTALKDMSIKRKDNSLIIDSDKPLEQTLKFVKSSKTSEEFALLTSLSYQDIIAMGSFDTSSFSFKIEVTGGIINLEKIDSVTEKGIARGEATLKGAVYEVFDKDNKSVGTITTDEKGKGSISLDYGTYTIKEVKAPLGYKISDEIYTVVLSKENDHVLVKAKDKVITGKVKLIKKKGGAGEDFSLENNAEFSIYDKNNNLVDKLVTNSKGMSIIELPYGTYTIKQTKGSEGYAFIDDLTINLKEDKIYEIDLENIKLSRLEFSKTDYSTSKGVPNTLIEIYKEDDTLLYSGRTDSNGKIVLPDLDVGKYYILEKDAPKEYKLNEEKMFFEVKSNGEIIKANMENKRYEGFLNFIKKDGNSNQLLSNAEIKIKFIEANKIVYTGKTDQNGEINIPLVVGNYCLYETKAPGGYELKKEPICFNIEKDKTLKVIMKNNKIIAVPYTSANNYKPIIGITLMILSLGTLIYEKKRNN